MNIKPRQYKYLSNRERKALGLLVSRLKSTLGDNIIMIKFFGSKLRGDHSQDSDIDVFDVSDVEWAVATRFQGSEDLVVIENVRGSTLDPSADQEKVLTSKVGFDATRPFSKPKEKFERARIPIDQGLEKLVRRLKKL